jgi:hypothetical protein
MKATTFEPTLVRLKLLPWRKASVPPVGSPAEFGFTNVPASGAAEGCVARQGDEAHSDGLISCGINNGAVATHTGADRLDRFVVERLSVFVQRRAIGDHGSGRDIAEGSGISGAQDAGIYGSETGISAGAAQGQVAAAILGDAAGAGDAAAENVIIGAVEDEAAIVLNGTRQSAVGAAISDLDGAVCDERAAGVGVGGGQDDSARVVLV